jgi:hypothetical protein
VPAAAQVSIRQRRSAKCIRRARERRRRQRADSARRAHLKKRLLVSDADSHVRFTPLLDQLQHAPLYRRRLPGRALGSDTSAVGGHGERSSKRNWRALVPCAPGGPPSRRGLRRVHVAAPPRPHGLRAKNPRVKKTSGHLLFGSWAPGRFCVYYTLRTETEAREGREVERRVVGRVRRARLSWPSCIGEC